MAMKVFYNKHFKLNKVYDFFMKFGINFWFFLKMFKYKSPKKKNLNRIKNYLYLGNNSELVSILDLKNYNVIQVRNFNVNSLKTKIKANSIDAVLFDNESILNKEIISLFQQLKNENVLLKIHPRSSNFIIGSTLPNERGEVEIL